MCPRQRRRQPRGIVRCAVYAAVALGASLPACDQVLVREPRPAAVAGSYQLTRESREFLTLRRTYGSIPDAALDLRSDGTLVVANVPDCAVNLSGDSGGRFLSGRGTWQIRKAYMGYEVWWTIAPGGSLPEGGYTTALRRRSPPYELELMVGDPDSGERVRYERSTGSR
jgi:hypothetical protein